MRRPSKGQKRQATQELLNSHKQHDYGTEMRHQHVKHLKMAVTLETCVHFPIVKKLAGDFTRNQNRMVVTQSAANGISECSGC